MQTTIKYVWDVSIEKNFTPRQLEIADEIASTISRGGDIKEMKKNLQKLKILPKRTNPI